MSYIYIASPYTHKDAGVRQARYQVALAYTAFMFETREHVFSPIVHCHNVALYASLPSDMEYWQTYDEMMVGHARELHVLCIPGWYESKGVNIEIDFARSLGIPVELISVDDLYAKIKHYGGITELYGELCS